MYWLNQKVIHCCGWAELKGAVTYVVWRCCPSGMVCTEHEYAIMTPEVVPPMTCPSGPSSPPPPCCAPAEAGVAGCARGAQVAADATGCGIEVENVRVVPGGIPA